MSESWFVPRRVVEALSDFTLVVDHLLAHHTKGVNLSRKKLYPDYLIGIQVEIRAVPEIVDKMF